MKSLALRASTGSLVLIAAACSSGQSSEEDVAARGQRLEPDPSGNEVAIDDVLDTVPSAEATLQSPEDALAQDLALVAKAKGWTIKEAQADREAADAVGRVAVKLAEKRPDIFVGSVISEEPGAPPTLLVKGPADESVSDLVAQEDIEIRVLDQQPFSFSELKERQQQATEALLDHGYGEFSIPVGIQGGGELKITVREQPDLPSQPAEIVQLLPETLRESASVTVTDEASSLQAKSFGGMIMWGIDTTVQPNELHTCTSGWTVGVSYGGWKIPLGITTAAHCSYIDYLYDPTTSSAVRVYLAGEHLGNWGDVEWHQPVSGTTLETRFYATTTIIRDVLQLEAWADIGVGESICFYSRLQGVRECDADVLDVSVTSYTEFGTVDNVVEMDMGVTIDGDSGGGWSWGNKAYGGHHGTLPNGNSAFSVADLFDEAIGVRVLTK